MSDEHQAVIARHDTDRGTLQMYVMGFMLSVTLTLVAYFIVVDHVLSKWPAALFIAVLAIGQFIVQLIFFLHLGREVKPRWRFGVFLFMLLIVFIVIGGSLWIMYNLNYRMMSPAAINQYMQDQNA